MRSSSKSPFGHESVSNLIAKLESLNIVERREFAPPDPEPAARTLQPEERCVPVVIGANNWSENSEWIAEAELRIVELGIEALAYYRPFHRYRNGWGIYIREEGMALIARILERATPAIYSGQNSLAAAYRLLHRHEYFHHLAEVACGLLEADTFESRPQYAVLARLTDMRPYDLYSDEAKRDPEGPLEESLANAYSIQDVPDGPWRQAICSWFKTQPRGYSSFHRYDSSAAFQIGLRRLSEQHQRAIRSTLEDAAIPAFRILSKIPFGARHYEEWAATVPVRIVPPAESRSSTLSFIRAIPNTVIAESDLFRRDVDRLQLRDKVEKAKALLGTDFRHRSLRPEWIRGCAETFSIRLDRKFRASIRRCGSNWVFQRAASHDELYRSPTA